MTNPRKSAKGAYSGPFTARLTLGVLSSLVLLLASACEKSIVDSKPDSVTAGSGTWANKAQLPVGMAEVGVAELNGKIYVVGGT